ncbi:hypothetical protein KIH86_06330 [Paenibacillus sp. HN-1]|uniref:hypothetical protein n=1 Tax=Paenibacillus TaxID=44249 RepID=UPI001CA9578A|nr:MULTISPECIES: hypothetical protein [Paenibacillus]MBY9078112.1 hypothetical protein [Paenibacillus sp. CGMCC 1.18879]MBY9083853.1 hypothetical protein [Paenibacillus sinensis]
MNGFFKLIGLIALIAAVLYLAKRFWDNLSLKKLTEGGIYEDRIVYQAAEQFAKGVPADRIRELLLTSYQFNEAMAQDTLRIALPHRNDLDGGYHSFLQAANQVLGDDVYL